MSGTSAADYDPPSCRAELIFPSEATPSIAEYRVYNRNAGIAKFGCNAWPLAALNNPDRRSLLISFADWPDGFQDFARHIAYALINPCSGGEAQQEHDDRH